MAVDKVEDIDYSNANVIYRKFFSDCQDAFVFKNLTLQGDRDWHHKDEKCISGMENPSLWDKESDIPP